MYTYSFKSSLGRLALFTWLAGTVLSAAADDAPPRGVPLAEAAAAGDTLFSRLDASETGLDFRIDVDVESPRRRLYEIAFAGAGIAVGDFDGDGRPDVFLSAHGDRDRLFRQTADFRFEDVTDAAGIGSRREWSAGASFVDINDDGLLDLYICHYDAPNALYINRGDGTFTDEAEDYGLDFRGASVMAAFADYDRDGDLDAYLLTSRLADNTEVERNNPLVEERGPGGRLRPRVPEVRLEYSDVIERPDGQFEEIASGQRDRLFRNDNGVFREVALPYGQRSADRDNHMGMAAVWWDYNQDDWPDLYVANDLFGPDRLYRNNGDGTFDDVIAAAVPHTPWYSMGADFADTNNDGLFDLIATDMAATSHYDAKVGMGEMDAQLWFLTSAMPRQYMRNALYINGGAGRFMEGAFLAGIASTDWTWSARFADFDNDGLSDLYVTNGMVRNFMDADVQREIRANPGLDDYWEVLKHEPPKRDTNLAFRNVNGLQFDNQASAWGLAHRGLSFAASPVDLDRDGDLDLIVGNLDEPVSVYRNNSTAGGRVLVRLRGSDSNAFGIGATVRIETASGSQVRQLSAARGFMTSDEPVLHFGTGEDTLVESLTVRWPGGREQRYDDLPVGQMYLVDEQHATNASPAAKPVRAIFDDITAAAGLTFRHEEIPYDDYAVQPLLPASLSQLGPGAAWGDADGDGDDDVFIGGAAGQAAALFLNDGTGNFALQLGGPWERDVFHEDMGAVWLDVEGDGDADLYVVSGGVEETAGGPDLRDRLYLNDGNANFSAAPQDALPGARQSGSVVAASDFDRDGDLDLFVGSRSVPGDYPTAPRSALLRNTGGRFSDVSAEIAPALMAAGMVTAALWSDVDADGDPDLMVAVEWGPIRLFRNDDGLLTEQTAAAGLSPYVGWWNGIAGADVDNDGDTDYVVTNTGLNSKYHASPDKPALLYYGDFGETGRRNLVEAKIAEDGELPLRGLSCSTDAMPFLNDEFATFDAFARADLEALYKPEKLDTALRYEATELRSGILVNAGNGRFRFEPLPALAQISPGFGIVSGDIDLDGNVDLVIAQNSFAPQAETGRMGGGLSVLLLGDGRGQFMPVWPQRSGLFVAGDAKSLSASDVDLDGRADILFTQNDDALVAFQPGSPDGIHNRRALSVRLRGAAGNPTGVGSTVILVRRDGSRQAAEIHAGSGYLSQSAPAAFFGNPVSNPATDFVVRWPDGETSRFPVGDGPVQVLQRH